MGYPSFPTLIFAFLLPGPSFSQTLSDQHPGESQETVTRQVQRTAGIHSVTWILPLRTADKRHIPALF
jgi:hypothetical protein